LLDRMPPSQRFASHERGPRGANAGDLVDHAIEMRAIVEKAKVLEARMKYQIEKLVRLAQDAAVTEQDVAHDPLAFRPNVQNLMPSNDAAQEDKESDGEQRSEDDIYRPPKLAPVPYNEETAKSKKTRAAPIAKALSSLAHLDPSMPYFESVSGLGSGSATKSSAARARLEEMTRYEEENMTRMLLNKKEVKRRKRDESDIALGGMGGGRARGGGLEEEFDDILKSVGRAKTSRIGDGYEELRHRSRKADALSRSRIRKEPEDVVNDGRDKKRSKFDKDVSKMKKKKGSHR